MRTLLILGLCATAMVANARTAKTDTVNHYAINGQKIDNFDGAMLLNRTISNYEIDTLVFPNKPVVLLHNIRTADAAPLPEFKITMRTNGNNGTPLTFINGVEAPAPVIINNDNGGLTITRVGDVAEDNDNRVISATGYGIMPGGSSLTSMKTYAPGSPEALAYGEKGKNGVVFVTTNSGPGATELIVVIDGKKSTEAEMKALDPNKIKSITMLKGNAAKEYTKDPNVGVVIVTTKK